jgi:nitroreductase
MKDAPEAKPYLDRLAFSDDYELLYAIGVGYPDESPEAHPRDAEKVKFVE